MEYLTLIIVVWAAFGYIVGLWIVKWNFYCKTGVFIEDYLKDKH